MTAKKKKRIRIKKSSPLGKCLTGIARVVAAVAAFFRGIPAFFMSIPVRVTAYFRTLPKKSRKQRLVFLASAAGTVVALAVLVAVLVAVGSSRKRVEAAMMAQQQQQQQQTSTPAPASTPEPTEQPTPEPTAFWLEKRDSGELVTQIQMRLMELGYLSIEEPTDYFGSGTEYAVELFQRQHGLDQDGIIGQQTYTLLLSEEAQPYVMKEGAEGRDVKILQEQLYDLGYLGKGDIDSIYGETTISAVKNFQKRNGLTSDGKAGEKTLAKMASDDAKMSYAKQKEAEKEEAAAKKNDTSSKDQKIEKLISAAKSKLSCEYILGDSGPKTFDCSGLLYYCLRQAGVYVRRLDAAGFSNKTSWTKITSSGSVQKGDLLFFKSDSSSRVSHCGIYIGNGMMIDASSANGKVIKRTFSGSAYWKRNFVCARRPWD